MGPAPITRAVSPFLNPLTLTACHATERGSAKAATSTERNDRGERLGSAPGEQLKHYGRRDDVRGTESGTT
jgi:hypothetical protein